MFHGHIGLKILFLLASSWVASGQLPLPRLYLETSSDRLTEGESIRIFCVAPGAYLGAYFYLFMVGQTRPMQVLPAPETQHQAAFLLENVTTSRTGLYRCQYGVQNGSRLQPSALSDPVEIIVEGFGLSTLPPTSPPGSDCQDPSWILLAALGVTGVLLLGMTLLVAAMALGGFKKRRQQKKKELNSCWTEGRRCPTELSFDNCVFTIAPKKRDQEAAESHRDAQPDFFTFRASE
ncbi:PREDICTED: protein HIDE1 [Gekko japonicus]|uniref:Protein HIDE1 n=1 Tax=Gekko japonicus TaxID=146911 RepID=A0ABM1K2D9_GEKJA|nr:PREDICTED: protein HIDE1 [Gekko japonicus]